MRSRWGWFQLLLAVAVLAALPAFFPGGLGGTTIAAYAEAENVCAICGHPVYPDEEIKAADDQSFHKTCFKCSVCARALNEKDAVFSGGKLYCMLDKPVPQRASV